LKSLLEDNLGDMSVAKLIGMDGVDGVGRYSGFGISGDILESIEFG